MPQARQAGTPAPDFVGPESTDLRQIFQTGDDRCRVCRIRSLWRQGRPEQETDEFSPPRIAEYAAGYARVRPLDPRAVVTYLRARGLQILAKQQRRGSEVEVGPTRKLAWLLAHGDDVHAAVARALKG